MRLPRFSFSKFLWKCLRTIVQRPFAVLAWAVAIAALVWLFFLFRPPANFPTGSIFHISEGSTISEVANDLKSHGYISSAFVFEKLVVALGKERGIIAGDYYFSQKYSIYQIVERLTRGVHDLSPVKVTIPEGYTVKEMADLLQTKLAGFDETAFLKEAQSKEGYLFPDTYFFMPNAAPEDIISELSNTFVDKMQQYNKDVIASGHSLSDIIIVASILEKEAATTDDRHIISGIIWKRLSLDMPLQIDATLGYVLNKGTFELTADDLKLDSPYNTYLYKGLPPTPISNPGLDAINAALHPSSTPYLYYLSDASGTIHYAKTFEEHKENREKYLGK